jgi:hypothetical protein
MAYLDEVFGRDGSDIGASSSMRILGLKPYVGIARLT